ncbi:amidohydrolase family protein [Streptomyces peucetius]
MAGPALGDSLAALRAMYVVTRAPVLHSHQVEPLPDDVLRGLRANNGVCMVMCTPRALAETADRPDRRTSPVRHG